MPASSPNLRFRSAFETTLRLAGPALDLLLVVGERISRVLERGDQGYGLVRMEHDGRSAPRTLDGYGRRSEAA
jgi:hypothetical protein